MWYLGSPASRSNRRWVSAPFATRLVLPLCVPVCLTVCPSTCLSAWLYIDEAHMALDIFCYDLCRTSLGRLHFYDFFHCWRCLHFLVVLIFMVVFTNVDVSKFGIILIYRVVFISNIQVVFILWVIFILGMSSYLGSSPFLGSSSVGVTLIFGVVLVLEFGNFPKFVFF